MKSNKLTALASGLLLLGASQVAQAGPFVSFWFDPDGAGATYSAFRVDEFFDIVGRSYVQNTYSDPSDPANFTFAQWGTVDAVGHDSAFDVPFMTAMAANKVGGTLELTGTGTLGSTINGNAGALTIRANGLTVGAFDVISAVGAILPSGAPNGISTTVGQATSFVTGYFYEDVAGVMGQDYSLKNLTTSDIFGFATTNLSITTDSVAKSIMEAPGTGLKTEFAAELGSVSAPYNTTDDLGRLTSFVSSGNGQFRISVPEPGSLALAGLGLLGLAGLRRRRSA